MTRSKALILLLCACVAWAIPPGTVIFIALSHNPQNEYMDPSGEINWAALFHLAMPSLVVGIALGFIVAMALIFIFKLLNQHRSND